VFRRAVCNIRLGLFSLGPHGIRKPAVVQEGQARRRDGLGHGVIFERRVDRAIRKPRPLPANGSCIVPGDPAEWLDDRSMSRVFPDTPRPREKPNGGLGSRKTGYCWTTTSSPEIGRQKIKAIVDRRNHRRHREGLDNLSPADVHLGRGEAILRRRERSKRKAIETGRLRRRKSAA
jgi:hypothetical protein